MKKLICVALILALILSLAALVGCGEKKAEPEAGSQVSPEASQDPAESENTEKTPLQQKLDAGEEVVVAAEYFNMTDAYFVEINNCMERDWAEMGVSFQYATCEMDSALMIQQLENFITMGVAAIYINGPASEELIDVAERAKAEGIYFVVFGDTPDYASGWINADPHQIGYTCAKMASAWLDMRYPDAADGEMHTALWRNSLIPMGIERTEGMKAAIAEDGRINVVYDEDLVTNTDEGYTAAENAFTFDPEIKLIVAFTNGSAIGSANYIMTRSGIDYADYAVFSTGLDVETRSIIDSSAENNTVFRGSAVGAADPDNLHQEIFDCILTLLNGENDPALLQNWCTITAYNAIGYPEH